MSLPSWLRILSSRLDEIVPSFLELPSCNRCLTAVELLVVVSPLMFTDKRNEDCAQKVEHKETHNANVNDKE